MGTYWRAQMDNCGALFELRVNGARFQQEEFLSTAVLQAYQLAQERKLPVEIGLGDSSRVVCTITPGDWEPPNPGRRAEDKELT